MFGYGNNDGCLFGMGHGYFGGIGMFIGLIFLIVLVFIIVKIFNGSKDNSFSGIINTEKETPLDILKKRYANGEISKEEFESMKKEII